MIITKKHTILLLCMILSITSCYKDKGNYSYSDPNKVTIKGLDKEYSAFTNITRMEIPIEVASDDSNKEFDYVWTLIAWKTAGVSPQYDTISLKKDLNYLVKKSQGSYKLRLEITEKDTRIAHYFESDVKVGTKYTKGWYVLKDNGTQTDLDLFNEETKLYNILPENGKILGKALYSSPVASFCYLNKQGHAQNGKNVLFVQSENDMKIFLIEDMEKIMNYNDCFNIPPKQTPKQSLVFTNMGYYSLADESGVYSMFTFSSNIGVFSFPAELERGYSIDKFQIKTSFNSAAVYDKLNCCLMIHVNGALIGINDKNGIGAEGANLNDMNADCLYMSSFENVSTSPNACAIFENRASKKRTLHLFERNGLANYNNSTVSVIDLKPNTVFATANIYCVNHDYAYIYYNNGNKLGYYNVLNHDTNDTIYEFDEGVVITHISYFYSTTPKKNNLLVGTYRDGRYKAYIFETVSAKPTGTPIILEGEGAVKEIFYYEPEVLLGTSSYR